MKILLLTDIHLNFLSSEKRHEFYKTLVDANPEAIFISGDIRWIMD